MATVMLIDGNSLTYRAFFALPTDMATASGQVTNAVFGFTSMLINLMRDHRPDNIAVSFDLPKPTFRHEKIPTYKEGRKETPDILRQQMAGAPGDRDPRDPHRRVRGLRGRRRPGHARHPSPRCR